MNPFYHTAPDGTKYRANLLSLDAYEAEGGSYDDGETNFGADTPDTRADFVAALVVDEKDGEEWAPTEDILRTARDLGVPEGALWRDASNGWALLRDWPAAAPLAARLVG